MQRVVGRHKTQTQGSEFARAVVKSRLVAASEMAAAPVSSLQEVPLEQSSPGGGARRLWSRDKAYAPDLPI